MQGGGLCPQQTQLSSPHAHGHTCCKVVGLSPPTAEHAQSPEMRMGSIRDFGPLAGRATARFSNRAWASETDASTGSSYLLDVHTRPSMCILGALLEPEPTARALPTPQASPCRGEEIQTAPLSKCTKQNSSKRDLSKNANKNSSFFPFKQNTVKTEFCFGLRLPK